MTKKQAQEIVKNNGFAWTVTEVIEDSENMLVTIVCLNLNKYYSILYSLEKQEIISIYE